MAANTTRAAGAPSALTGPKRQRKKMPADLPPHIDDSYTDSVFTAEAFYAAMVLGSYFTDEPGKDIRHSAAG